jgi:8-oxo-dGTP pyrophosphatase MutT (NUDIX family)
MSDIAFTLHDHRINLRAGAVMRRGDEVLLVRNPRLDLWYTPGGRIKVGEDSTTALLRELQEELGGTFVLGRPLLVGENFFTFRTEKVHEVCFYHEVIPDGRHFPALTPDGEEVHWVALAALPALKLVPPFLKEHLLHPQPGLRWIAHRDEPIAPQGTSSPSGT